MRTMKNKISFLTALIVAFGVNCADASEYIEDNDELLSTNINVVDVLEPKKTSDSIWFKPAFESSGCNECCEKATCMEESCQTEYCNHTYDCPFKTSQECEIWYKKPVYNEAVNPREPCINSMNFDNILNAIENCVDASANDAVFEPLIERYKMLMRASKSCCTEGIIYKLQTYGASDYQIYQFLKSDANFFNVGARCLVLDDSDIYDDYYDVVDGETVSDVRNACLCKNRKWFDSLLAPFAQIYQTIPEFKYVEFNYDYTDSMQRNVSVSVNKDVQNVIDMLEVCPD